MIRLPLLTVSFIFSLLIFQSGFLLKRQEIHVNSTCADFRMESHVCWMPKQQRKIVLLVIDALRHDFLVPPRNGAPPAHFRGQMASVARLIEKGATIGTVLADPPTTTLQRLKAMTTGTLPTFIDAGDNFSPDAQVLEDSYLAQAKKAGLKVSFFGDDTWLSMYPDVFSVAHGFSSFDINDLTGVDDQVIALLGEELSSASSSSSLVIGHLLGVDHCGHKFGPAHPQMGHVLRRMDELIGTVASKLSSDDLLIVLGDHGMTSTGDHGGDSDDETHAGIMLYSPGRSLSLPSLPIQQIDLVPTLSLLLGLPIPFSNLGTVIQAAFQPKWKDAAVLLNYEQMRRYATTYAGLHSFGELLDLTAHDATEPDDQLLLMSRLQRTLRAAWTKFDWPRMRIGLVSLMEAMMFMLSDRTIDLPHVIVRSGCLLLQLSVLLGGAEENPAVSLLIVVLPLSVFYSIISIVFAFLPTRPSSANRIIAFLAVSLHSISFLSNSFVVYEGHVTRFLLQSVLVFVAVNRTVRSRPAKKQSLTSILTSNDAICLFIALFILRSEPLFHRCREEEIGCDTHYPVQLLGNLTEDAIFWRLILSIGCMCGLDYLLDTVVSQTERRTRGTMQLFWAIGRLAILISTFYFAVQAVVSRGGGERLQEVAQWLARIVYILSSTAIGLTLVYGSVLPRRERHLYVFYALCWSFFVLFGDGLVPAVCSLIILIGAVFQLCDEDSLPYVCSLLCSFGFYLTGHSPTITAIPWQAAFVGVAGNFSIQAVPALLVLSHICVSTLLVTLSLPLNPLVSLTSLHSLVAASSIRAVSVSLAAVVHRRHLMVWKIFAPKFIFESVSFICLLLIANITFLTSRKLFVSKV